MSIFSKSRYLVIILACILFLAFALGPFGGYLPVIKFDTYWKSPKIRRDTSSFTLQQGRELTLVYIGSSTCYFSNKDFLPRALKSIKSKIKNKARENGYNFVTMGISRDWSIERGIDHLERMGEFDEISVGRSWANQGLLKYIWNEIPGRPAIPQVLVVDQNLKTPDGNLNTYRIEGEKLIIRKVGVNEIKRWIKNRIAMPSL